MDFSTLMRQAAVNKVQNEKTYEQKKEYREHLKARDKAIEEERRRIIQAKLKKFDDEAIRQRMRYKGIPVTSSSGSATPSAITKDIKGTDSAAKQRQEAPRPAVNDTTSLPPGRKPSSGTTPKRTSDKSATKSQLGAKNQSDKLTPKHTSVRPVDRKTSTSPTPSPRAPAVKKSVNFQDMMKLAQRNLHDKATLSVPTLSDKSRKSKSPSPISSAKRKMADKNQGTGSGSKKSGVATAKPNGYVQGNKSTPSPVKPVVGSKQSGGPNSSLTKSQKALPATPQRAFPVTPQSADRGFVGAKTPRINPYAERELARANAMAKRREAKAVLDQKRSPAQKSEAFYGAASKRLPVGGMPKFSSQRAPMKYMSGWVDEMAEFMQKETGEDFDDDDEDDAEDDLDDFVVDDDADGGYGGQHEYSSAIREIFGYDKRRFVDTYDDDEVMESSYNQQQFEESRSARIGRMEDEEDIRREQEELARKRKRKSGGKGILRKEKLPKSKFL